MIPMLPVGSIDTFVKAHPQPPPHFCGFSTAARRPFAGAMLGDLWGSRGPNLPQEIYHSTMSWECEWEQLYPIYSNIMNIYQMIFGFHAGMGKTKIISVPRVPDCTFEIF